MNRPTAKSMTCPRCGVPLAAASLLHHPPDDPRASRALDRRYCPQCGARVEIDTVPSRREWAVWLAAIAINVAAIESRVPDGARTAIFVATAAIAALLAHRRPRLIEPRHLAADRAPSAPVNAGPRSRLMTFVDRVARPHGTCPRCETQFELSALRIARPGEPAPSRVLERRYCPSCGCELALTAALGVPGVLGALAFFCTPVVAIMAGAPDALTVVVMLAAFPGMFWLGRSRLVERPSSDRVGR